MESGFLAVILVSSFGVYSSHTGVTEWDDVVVAREGWPTTLVCADTTVRGAVVINWMAKSYGTKKWKLVLSANERKEFSGIASKQSMRLTDPNFLETGVYSLSFFATREDDGIYSCLIKQQETKLRVKTILLAILTVTILPSPTIPQHSTLRLIASVHPDTAAANLTWAAPDGILMKTEKIPNNGTEAKLPQVQNSDNGVYVCTVYPWGNSSSALFAFPVNVTIDANNVVSFTKVIHGTIISTAAQAQTPLTLICPSVQGDYSQLYWQPPDSKTNNNVKRVYEYDRWRSSTSMSEKSNRLQLAGPPYNAEAGSFSFRLVPEVRDGGLYICDVFLNDEAHSQRTQLTVLKVETKSSTSKLELICQYSELSQVRGASWRHQNKKLAMESIRPGMIITTLPLPVTSDTAGYYKCVLELKNGQTIWGIQAVTLPSKENVSVTTPSTLPSLSALLLLVPLVAAAVGVLLWRQKQISERGIEQSLSVQSREVENIYENPEDIRQAPPQGSVYMDLKPRGEDDVYKELERYEQCQSRSPTHMSSSSSCHVCSAPICNRMAL